MSIVVSAWCADRTTIQDRLSRTALIVICSRIMNVSFTPGVSRTHSMIGISARSMYRSADLVMSVNRPWSAPFTSSSPTQT